MQTQNPGDVGTPSEERVHAVVLAHRLIEFAETIDVITPLQREAIVQSLEAGSLIRDVESALRAARDRERDSNERPTPTVPVDPFTGDCEDTDVHHTLPTVPPGVPQGDPPTRPHRSLTARGFPPPMRRPLR